MSEMHLAIRIGPAYVAKFSDAFLVVLHFLISSLTHRRYCIIGKRKRGQPTIAMFAKKLLKWTIIFSKTPPWTLQCYLKIKRTNSNFD